MFVVIEGTDGSGKSTIAKAVAERLHATLQVFPDRTTPLGKVIDSWLKREWRTFDAGVAFADSDAGTVKLNAKRDAIVLQGLMFANQLERLSVLRASSPTEHVVADRYTPSAYVYGGKLDGLDTEWLLSFADALPKADLYILLDASPEVSAERQSKRGSPKEHYEALGVLQRIREGYLELWAKGSPDAYKIVNANLDFDTVLRDVGQHVWRMLGDLGSAK